MGTTADAASASRLGVRQRIVLLVGVLAAVAGPSA